MAVKIRLSRVGTKNAPMYRIVVVDSRAKRDGASLEIIGSYNPRSGNIVQLYEDRVVSWIGKGAQMTDSVRRIYKMYRKNKQAQA